jgi:flagellar biosynthesis protein FlhG
VSLTRQGRTVLLFDWGGGPKGAGWLVGVEASVDLLDVVRAGVAPTAACLIGSAGVRVVAAGRAAAALGGLSEQEEARLAHAVETLRATADVVIVDAAPNDLPACAAADELLLVTGVDPESMTDAYRLLKRLGAVCGLRRGHVLMNRARIAAQADRIFGNLSSTAMRFLGITLELTGRIPYDERMEQATRLRQPVLEAFPDASSARILRECAASILRWPERGSRTVAPFANRLVAVARAIPSS